MSEVESTIRIDRELQIIKLRRSNQWRDLIGEVDDVAYRGFQSRRVRKYVVVHILGVRCDGRFGVWPWQAAC